MSSIQGIVIGDVVSRIRDVSARELGMLPGTDITDRFISILSDATYKNIVIQFEKKAIYYISKPIVIDLFKYGVDGKGCIFNFRIKDQLKWGITLTSSASVDQEGVVLNGASPGANSCNVFSNIIMQCEDKDKNCRGLYFNNQGIGKPAHTVTHNICIFGFFVGVGFGNNAYMITNNHTNIQFCGTGIAMDTGVADVGERCTFNGGLIGDCDLIIRNTTDQAMHFQNVSCDFSYKFFENTGQLYFTNCHIEAPVRYIDIDNDEYYWGEVGGFGSVIIVGSRIIVGSGADTKRKKAIFNLKTANSYLNISNCHIYVFTSYMATGLGRIRFEGTKRYNTLAPFVLAHDKLNLYFDADCKYLPSSDECFTRHVSSTNVVDSTTLQPVLDAGGYQFIHKQKTSNSMHYIKLPTRGMRGGTVSLTINIPAGEVFNYINFSRLCVKQGDRVIQVGTDRGGFTFVEGDNTISINLGITTSNSDEPILHDFYLMLNTFQANTGSTFRIKNIKVRPAEFS